MKIISWNVNGIRACHKKGFSEFLETEAPDVLCLQETKANVEDLDEHIVRPSGYHSAWFSASSKKGYSGVAIFTKDKPQNIVEGFGIEKYDREGRVLMADYGDFAVFSVYFPNGQMNEDRLIYKLDFYNDFFAHCNDLRDQGKHLIITGDYNTAHHPIDLARPKENESTSGFMPIEREWMDKLEQQGYVDTFREFNKDPEEYSWWSYRTRARERNVGWRIDYCFVDQAFLPQVTNAFILQGQHGSDHCPVGIEIK
ncbi:exodeoxyribonuclease III [bacterium]|jgi:exodeoxyribonuclease III|nr:exodeoxyribonuclease III [bacterium]